MVRLSEGRTAAAERGIPGRLRPGAVVGQMPGRATHTDRSFFTGSAVSRHRIANRLGWMTGWGFISTGGRYGCGKYPQFELRAGADPDVVTELRAVWHAIGEHLADEPLTLTTASAHTAAVLTTWQAGGTTMPAGYTGSRRKAPTLHLLQQLIAAHPRNLIVVEDLDVNLVLTEGAATLAQLGTRWAVDDLEADYVSSRAQSVAEGFLTDHRQHHR